MVFWECQLTNAGAGARAFTISNWTEKITLVFSFSKKLAGTKWSPNRAKSVRNLVWYCKNKVQPAYAKSGQILQIGIHATNTLVWVWTYEKVSGGKQGMDSCIPCKVAICSASRVWSAKCHMWSSVKTWLSQKDVRKISASRRHWIQYSQLSEHPWKCENHF